MRPSVDISRLPARADEGPRNRAHRKARLENDIEQQRIDILVEASRWHEAGRPLDDAWRGVMRFKGPLLATAGVLLWRNARRPGAFTRLFRRLAGGALLVNRARRLLRWIY